ncbi:MAG: hypothetical protein D6714_00135, partial [Bacteroidetes bacterium]
TTDADCGQANGAATLTLSGNISDYAFGWTNNVSQSATATNLSSGIYEVTISLTNNPTCDTIITVEIGDDCGTGCTPPTIANISISNATCGAANGAATIEVVGVPDDYHFIWDNSVSTTNTATGLTAGIYGVTITRTDDPDCFAKTNLVIGNVDGPQAVVAATTNANCGNADGTALLAPDYYVYQWPDGQLGASRNDLAGGLYHVTVTDPATGCENILTVEIDETGNLIASAQIIAQPDCGQGNGTVEIVTSGGSGNYDYSWGNSATQNDLAPGSYAVTVTDQVSGCSAVVNFVLTENVPAAHFDLAAETIYVACAGNADGEVEYDLTLSPGFVEPAQVEIQNMAGEIVQNGSLGAGMYVLLVTDANGCLAGQAIFEVVEPAPLQLDIMATNVTCDEAGVIKLEVAGGTAPYQYIWSDLPGSTDQDERTGLSEGMYAVTVLDGNDCQVKAEIEILNDCTTSGCDELFDVENMELNVPYCEDAEICVPVKFTEIGLWIITDNGQIFDGTIKGCDYDSTLNYDYSNLFGGGFDGPYFLNQWIFNGTAYNGQFQTIQSIVDAMNSWDVGGNWVLDVTNKRISGGTPGNAYGDLTITHKPTGAIAIIKLNTQMEPRGTALGLAPGSHTLVLTNSVTGCADTLDVEVKCGEVTHLTEALFVQTSDTLCFDVDWLPGTVTSIENICEENAGEYALVTTLPPNCIVVEGMDIGSESVCLVICDDLGFCDTTYLDINIIENPGGTRPDAVDDLDDTYKDQPVIVKVLDNDTLNGNLTDIQILTQPANGTIILNPDGTISYIPFAGHCEPDDPDYFTYQICNPNGCDTATVYIKVDCEKYVIFSGFSPNNDGINDFFTIQGIERMTTNKLIVFNRWGNEVYRAENYRNDWDGTFDGKDLPDGTYFYIFEDDEGRKVSGYVQILR